MMILHSPCLLSSGDAFDVVFVVVFTDEKGTDPMPHLKYTYAGNVEKFVNTERIFG
jgi:hypothetical protein